MYMEELNDHLQRESGKTPGGVEEEGRRQGEYSGGRGSRSGIGQGVPVTGDISSTDGISIERFD